jgi:hypothetical protein
MSLSAQMAQNTANLQQTLRMSTLNMAQSVQAAGAIVMLEDFQNNQKAAVQAPHPHAGKHIDLRM